MPRVYKHSYIDVAALEQQTSADAAVEKEPEEKDAPDLSSDVLLGTEAFCDWILAASCELSAGTDAVCACPCGAFIWATARDVQVEDVRGSLSPDVVWEYCCRSWGDGVRTEVFRTSHLAQLILFWIQGELQTEEEPDLQSLEMDHDDPLARAMFAGVYADASDRGQDMMTEKDKQTAKVRWLRLAIHGELERLQQVRCETRQGFDVEWEIEGAILQSEESALLPSSAGQQIVHVRSTGSGAGGAAISATLATKHASAGRSF